MEGSLKNFDTEALQWDEDVEKVKRANLFANEIVNFIHPDKSMTAMEFGCGTGLLSFELRDKFKTITLIDNSPGMISVLEEKIKVNGLSNFEPICIDPLVDDVVLKDFDVIYTLMTLHHIHELQKIMQIFNSGLKTGGYLCIADLISEDGTFHSKPSEFTGHKGFDKEELSLLLKENGFQSKFYKIVFTIEKEVDGRIKKYPLFLVIAKKIKESL